MASAVGDVVIGVTADIGPLLRETQRAEAAMNRFSGVMKGIGGGFSNLGARATDLGKRMSIATGAITAAGAAALALTRSAANMGEEIANGAKAAGMSTTAFQEYRYALSEAADMSDEDFANAAVRLNKVLGEAAQGSKTAAAALDAIGISAADIASGTITTDEAMARLVGTLEKTTDPALAAAIATDVLGKSGARMGGLLAGTAGDVDALRSTAQSLGLVMSEDAVNASDKFNEAWDRTAKQIEAVKMAIAEKLMPILTNDLLPLIQNTVIPAVIAVVNKIGEWATVFQALPGPVKEAISVIALALGTGGPLLVAIGMVSTAFGALVAATGPIGLFIAAAALAAAAWAKWGDDIKATIGGAIDWVTAKFDAFMGKINAIVETLRAWKDTAADFIGAGDRSTFTPNPDYQPDPNGPETWGAGMDSMGGGAGSDMLGISMADGMVNGLQAQLEARKADIAAAVDAIPQIARDRLGIHSPSTVFAEIGSNVSQGMANGIASAGDLVRAAVTSMGDGAVTSTRGFVSETLGVLGDLFQGSKAIAAAQALVNAWAGASEALKLPFPANILSFGKVLATGMGAVRAIQGARVGGGGGGGGASAAVAAPAAPQSIANVTLNGDYFSRGSVESLFEQINQGLKQGRVINMVRG